MALNNTAMILKLQNAINQKFHARILFNKTQWYSEKQERPITLNKISKAVWNEEKQRYMPVELFSSYSQLQIVLFLRDYWYELNGWEVPTDNQVWVKAKQEYYEKHNVDMMEE